MSTRKMFLGKQISVDKCRLLCIIHIGLILAEALLTCIISPCASAAPVVTQKLGGNLEEMTTGALPAELMIHNKYILKSSQA